MKYSTSFRNSVLKKILPPSNRSVTSVSKMIFDSESDVHAAELFDATCRKENCHPDFVHSDNGEPMKGITLCTFYYQVEVLNPD